MTLSGLVEKVVQVKNHVGWFGKSSAEYYCRMSTLVDSGVMSRSWQILCFRQVV